MLSPGALADPYDAASRTSADALKLVHLAQRIPTAPGVQVDGYSEPDEDDKEKEKSSVAKKKKERRSPAELGVTPAVASSASGCGGEGTTKLRFDTESLRRWAPHIMLPVPYVTIASTLTLDALEAMLSNAIRMGTLASSDDRSVVVGSAAPPAVASLRVPQVDSRGSRSSSGDGMRASDSSSGLWATALGSSAVPPSPLK